MDREERDIAPSDRPTYIYAEAMLALEGHTRPARGVESTWRRARVVSRTYRAGVLIRRTETNRGRIGFESGSDTHIFELSEAIRPGLATDRTRIRDRWHREWQLARDATRAVSTAA